MEFERKGLNNEDENNSSSNDEETADAISPDQLRTYFIVVNDDGTLVLDSNRVTSEDADPQTVIPVQLPINKLKSPDCPLPGATPIAGPSTGGGGRSRKSKPQAILYGGDNDDGVYEYSTTSTTSSSYQLSDQTIVTNGSAILADSTTGGTMASGTPLDIAQLGPQEIAILENVLQSEQAREFRELLENCSLQEEIPAAPAVSSHLWDHSYSALSAPLPQPPHTPTISTAQATPRVVSTLATTTSTIAAEATSEASTAVPPAKSIIKVSLGNVNPGKKTSPAAAKGSPSPRASPSLSSASSSPNARRISESESASIRRSQRQQDRIERQEAERIMAENQQMLQREKEMMMENKHQQQLEVAVPQMTSVSPSLSPQIMGETSSISPVPPPPAPVTPVEAKSTSPEESPRGVQRPMRQRKLPAHLADPNILQLEDEPMTTKVAVEETKTVADPNSSLTEEETTEDEEELTVEEDDPNKLWCICRQPHNNRFMICCDKCDDWFHGKCVGVTKAQAKQMEQKNIQWHCPPCRKIIKQEKAAEKGIKYVGPGRPPGRRGSETSVSSRASAEPSIKSKRGSIDIIRSPTDTPKRRDSFGPSGRRRKADSTSGGDEDQIFAGCIVCGKKPRAGSVFCSDDCIRLKAGPAAIKAAKDSPSPSPSPAPSSGSSTPLNAATSPQKPKRLNSKSEAEKAEPIFDFHVIQAGVSKSTEVVPAKQKEAMAKAAAALGTPSEKVPGKPPPASPSPKTQQPGGKTLPTPPPPASSTSTSSSKDQKVSKEPEKASGKSSSKSSGTTPKSSEGNSKEKKKVKESPKPEKEVTRSGKDENLMKDSFKKFIGETLKTRIKELSEDQVSSFSITPENLAVSIVEELSELYGSSINPKYKNKYRSICFNLKDQKNHLFRELLSGSLTPKTLVRMESTEMASAELSEWRNRENQKNLEMIKRAEIDKLVEAKKQELLEKGADVEVAVAVEEEARKLDIEGILDAKDAKEHEKKDSNGSKSKSHSSSSSAASSSHHRKDKKYDRHKDRHKEKHHSPKERDKTDNSRSSSKDSRSGRHHHKSTKEEYDKSSASKTRDKDGDKRVKSSKEKDEKKYREKERKSREEIKDSKGKNEVTEDTNKTANDAGSKTEESKLTSRNSIDSEQEFPSSTIKTPDFAEDKKDVQNSAAFHTKLMMHELGSFNASAFHVSHNTLEGVYFPESPVPIVGRIAPETVWDYLDKMKKTKEVIVLRLTPESEADNDGYMTFFTYLSSRGRLGVMGGITSPLKDVYLIPLDKHSPVNRALLPFRGPGLPKDRSHCLLAVVTRHLPDFIPIAQIKRKASTTTPDATSTPVLKKKKGEAGPKVVPVLADRDPRRKDARKNNNNDDDDAPYTPWEDEDDNKPTIDATKIEGGEGKPPAPEKLLEDIERQIQQQRQEIESITSAIKLNETITHIPGLDGDFTTTKESSSSAGAKAHADVPFYLKSQPTTSKAVVMDQGSKVSAVADSTEVEIIPPPSTEEEAGKTEELATTKPVEDEEAYSPTAMDFSDDEKEVEKDGRTTRTVLMESSGSLPFEAINTTTRMDMIPGLDLSHEDPPEPESTRLSPSPPPAPEVIDLDDDEPPPPGEALLAKAGPKISLESVFTLPPPANPNQKPKIQINLGAKSLGSSVLASVAKSAQEGDLMPSTSMTASSALPSLPPSVPSIPLPIGVPTNIPPPSLTPMPPTSLTSMPPTSFPPPGFQAPPMSLPPAGFPAIPPRPPPPMMMPSVVPPSALGGINLSVPPPNVSVPPPNVGVLPPNVGMVPVTSIPPLPPLRGMPPNVNRPRFGPGPGGAAPAPQQQAPGNRFRPIGGRFLEGSSSRPPYQNNGGNKRNSFNNSTGGTVVDDTKTNYRHRGSPPERHRGRYGRHRSRSRSRSKSRSRSRSRSREHRRRRRHSRSRSRSRSRSPQSSRRRSRSRSPPPPSRRLTSRSPITRVRRRKSRSPSPSVSSSSSSSSTAIKKSQQ